MPTHDPDKILAGFVGQKQKLCYYPSCGNRSLWPIMQLDADIFVFSDYYSETKIGRTSFWEAIKTGFARHSQPVHEVFSTVRTRVFQVGNKWGFLFFQDNNAALERIRLSGLKIHTFVGICDGCSEGGNYECVHKEPFLGKLLTASEDRLEYFTDHSDILQIPRTLFNYERPQYFKGSVPHPDGWDFQLNSLLVWLHPPGVSEANRDALKLAILTIPEKERLFIDDQHAIDFFDRYPLGRLSPMRQLFHHSILAHYNVCRAPTV